MNGRGWVLAVVGAASQIGREVQAAALERGLPVREWRLYDTTEEGADLVREDLPAPLLPGEPVDLDGVDVVFLCGPAAASAAAVERSRAARAIVIDVIQSLAEDEAAFIVPEVNGDTIAEALDRAVFACPLPGATALSVVLHPLHAVAELRRVVVTAGRKLSSNWRAKLGSSSPARARVRAYYRTGSLSICRRRWAMSGRMDGPRTNWESNRSFAGFSTCPTYASASPPYAYRRSTAKRTPCRSKWPDL